MQLVCEKCGEEQEFYRLDHGIQSIEADGSGQEIGDFPDFEPEGSPWYECAICGSSFINDVEGGT